MDVSALFDRLEAYPRLPLGNYPTPLEFLPRLSQALHRPVYIKRDDTIGPGLGGNKTRKLEYLLADACEQNARRVVTFGGLQSNHACLTAAAARKFGLEPHLFYFAPRPPRLTGNLLLNHLLGAQMHFVPLGGNSSNSMTVEANIRLVQWVARLRLGRHYFIPVGGHHWLGGLGYVRAAAELHSQAHDLGIDSACVVVAAGSGGTLAGLLAGLALLDSPLRLLGVDVGRLWKNFPDSIARLAGEVCAHLGQPAGFTAGDVPLVENTYVGQCYGQPSPGCRSALEQAARLEGLLLDPVYTGKAFDGMLDWCAAGERCQAHLAQHPAIPQLEKDQPVIFVHTGGLPALFAFDRSQL